MVRPEIPIDWDKVDQLLIAGCTSVEVAGNLGIHRDTLTDRILGKYGISYSEYSAKLRSKGHSLLRAVQFNSAMKGNTQMQIHLGKFNLGQIESSVEQVTSPEDTKITIENKTMENQELKRQIELLKEQLNVHNES